MNTNVIIIGEVNGRVSIYNKWTGEYITHLSEHTGSINKILLINNGNKFITASADCTSKLVTLVHTGMPHLSSDRTFSCNSGMLATIGDSINDVLVDNKYNV